MHLLHANSSEIGWFFFSYASDLFLLPMACSYDIWYNAAMQGSKLALANAMACLPDPAGAKF